MTKIEELVKKHVEDNDIFIDVRKYNGSFETTGLPLNTKVMYLTNRCTNNTPLLLECKVIDRIKNCQHCTLKDFKCNCIDCNLELIKIYRV